MKIGIITHYYKSQNYGGNLQAWALCRVLNGLGYQAEQISYERSSKRTVIGDVKKIVKKVIYFRDSFLNSKLLVRKNAFKHFNLNLIPHSKVFNDETISNCVDDYDAFITGSDQVWHPVACCDAYLLAFAPSDKIKISYAASIAHNVLPPDKIEKYRKALCDYKAISVREEDAIELLRDVATQNVECTLDPTLLVSREEWDEISSPANINEDFMFCYFLGDDQNARRVATEFARKHSLKIVTLPHLLGRYRSVDKNFGDYKLYDVSPERFISLVKDAKYVFTDSFHATVFSLLFEKEHFVFQRSGYKSMNTRIYNLVSMFGTDSHFCDTNGKTALDYIDKLDKIDYSQNFVKFEEMKTKSIQYLINNLKDSKEKV